MDVASLNSYVRNTYPQHAVLYSQLLSEPLGGAELKPWFEYAYGKSPDLLTTEDLHDTAINESILDRVIAHVTTALWVICFSRIRKLVPGILWLPVKTKAEILDVLRLAQMSQVLRV